MTGVRRGFLVGLAAGAPVVVWALPQLGEAGDDVGPVVRGALAGLWTALALAAPLFGTWIAAGERLGRAGAGFAMLVLTPLPAVTLLASTGGASPGAVLRGLAMLGAWSFVCLALARAAGSAAPPGSARAGALGCGLAVLALSSRATWLAWIGP